MKLLLLLESVKAKKIALTLQQAFLAAADEFDVGEHVSLKLISITPGWKLSGSSDIRSSTTDDRWTVLYSVQASAGPETDVLIMVRDNDPLVQLYMTSTNGNGFAYVSDMTEVQDVEEMKRSAIDLLEGVLERIGVKAIEELNAKVAKFRREHDLSGPLHSWSEDAQKAYANKPIPNALSTSLTQTSVVERIGKATLLGYQINSVAIYKCRRTKDALSWAKAQNDFNDQVLRSDPKPLQLHVSIDRQDEAALFVYGTKP